MARSFGAESLGADGFAVRGAVSAAPAVGCALVELGSNQLGWTSAPVALNSDLSLKANRAGDTFTGDVIINRTWLGTPTEDKNVIKVGRYQSGSNATVNSPIAWYEHIADAPYPYCGFVLKHGLNPGIVDGRNPGGSYINMIGPEHSFAIQFDYLSSVGTPNYQGDAQYNLTGSQSKHIFRVNNGTEVGRFDANGLRTSEMQFGTNARLQSPANGQMRLIPSSGTDSIYQSLIFGPGTSTTDGVRINRSVGQTRINIRNGNDTAFADIGAATGHFANGANITGALNVNGSLIQTATSPSGGGVTLLQISPSHNMMLGTGSNGRVQINNGGAVSNPVRALNVYDDASSVYQIRMGHGNSFYWEMGRDNATTGDFSLAGPSGPVLRITNGGAFTFTGSVGYVHDLLTANSSGAGIRIRPQNLTQQVQMDWGEIRANQSYMVGTQAGPLDLFSAGVLRWRVDSNGNLVSFDSGGSIIAPNSVASLANAIVHRGSYLNYNSGMSGTTNYERGFMRWVSNEFNIGNEVAGTGTQRFVKFNASGYTFMLGPSPAWYIDPNRDLLPANTTTNIGSASLPVFRVTANNLQVTANITQGSQDARWTVTATGKRDSQVGNGSGTWQTGYREEYNAGGVRAGFFGATPVAQQSIAPAATDPATTQTLANSLRTAMLNLGLGV